VCDNCEAKYEREDDLKHVFPDIPDLLERLDAGGTVPAGECPAYGALVYPPRDPIRVLVLLDGGLVQDVVADRRDVDAAVLDMDIEGADEDEIVRVTGDGYDLRGTLQAHEPSLAPAVIDSAWRAA